MRVQRLTVLLAMVASLLAFLPTTLLAEQRVALVIGNANYAHATRLANPLNDAADIGDALARLGFAVTKLENADYAALRQGMLAFTRAAAAAEVAVVFYAGHGIEVDQRNFLVPVDARLTSDQDVEYEAVPLELVTRSVARASGLRLVILDACRENPFAASMQRAGATRAIGRGLARVEPAGETLVAYASKEGTVAADGEGRNSPYSEALLAHLEEPGLEVGLLFRKVRDAVLAATGGRQEPFVYGSLSSRGVYLTARAEPEPTPSPAPPTAVSESVSERLTAEELAAERVFWESVKDSPNVADFEAYLSHYPQGRFALLAHNRLAAFQQSSTSPVLPVVTAESIEAGLELSRADRRLAQLGLEAEGFDPGPADGLFGRGTRGAIGRWQASQGDSSTEYLDAESAKLLLASGTKRKAEEQKRRQAASEAARQKAQKRAKEAADDAAYAKAKSLGTVESYEAYLRVYPSGRHAEEARRLRSEAKERLIPETIANALVAAERIEDFDLRGYAFRTIAQVQAKVGNFGDALVTANNIGDASERARTFIEIAQAQLKAGNTQEAGNSLSSAIAAAQRTQGYDSARRFAEIAQVQVDIGGGQQFQNVQKSLSKALAAARGIEDNYWRSAAFRHLSRGQFKARRSRDGERSLSESRAAIQRVESDYLRAGELVRLSEIQADVGNLQDAERSLFKALEAARTEDSDSLRVKALVDIAAAQTEAGNVEHAKKSWSEALATAQRMRHYDDRAEAFADIALALAETGSVKDAEQPLSKALAAGRRLKDKSDHPFVFVYIVEAQAKTGRFEEALKTARAMDHNQWNTPFRAFAAIAEAQANAGKFREALMLADEISVNYLRARAFVDIAEALAGLAEDQTD